MWRNAKKDQYTNGEREVKRPNGYLAFWGVWRSEIYSDRDHFGISSKTRKLKCNAIDPSQLQRIRLTSCQPLSHYSRLTDKSEEVYGARKWKRDKMSNYVVSAFKRVKSLRVHFSRATEPKESNLLQKTSLMDSYKVSLDGFEFKITTRMAGAELPNH